MQADKCQSIRDSIVRFVVEHTVVEEMRNLCVATIPIPTVDGRLVDVFIEIKIGDSMLVHDGGKAANELIIQGIELTDAINHSCSLLASTFGVCWRDETFEANCKPESLNRAVMGVATCSALATFHL